MEDGRLQLPPVVEKNAAEELLGENLTKRLAAIMTENWSDEIRDQWLARYQSAYKAQQRMKQLAKDAEILKPAEKDAWERAQLTAEFGDKELARTLLEQFVQDYPEHLQAQYGLGNLLLEAGDEAGIPHLEHVMEQDAEAVLPACEAIYSFWMEKGKFEEAKSFLDQARTMYERLEDDRLERTSVTEEDSFLPHGIPYERLRLLIDFLRDFDPWLKAVYLVQKKLSVLPGRPLYVLGVVATKPIFANVTLKQVEEQLGMALRFQFQQEGATYVLILNKENEKISPDLSADSRSKNLWCIGSESFLLGR